MKKETLNSKQEDFLLEQSREDKPLTPDGVHESLNKKKGCGKQFKKYWNNIDFDYLNCGKKYNDKLVLCKACSGDEE